MNMLMYCTKCKSHWWSATADKCMKCDNLEKTKLTEEDKQLLNLLAKTEEDDEL